MHRHADLRATADTYARSVLAIDGNDRCYSVAKLFFAYGLGNSLTFPFAVGRVGGARSGPAHAPGVVQNLTSHQPTLFFASPGFCAALLDADAPVDAFSSVRMAVTAGESLPGELYRRFTERYDIPVLDGIGSTEALHIFLSNHLGRERPGTSGTPVDGYRVKLLDDEGTRSTPPTRPATSTSRASRSRPVTGVGPRPPGPRSTANGCARATCTRGPTTTTGPSSAATTT